jgi:trehalose 6-phosphate synthase
MSRLVIVSNGIADPQCETSGGLTVCILQGLRQHGGLWFGWDGSIVEDESEISITRTRHDNVAMVTMPLTERDFQEFYLGYCNEGLWPVFHYRLDLARFTQESSESYRRVNERFAESLARLLTPSDLVWVHDYHLIPLAAGLRARGAANRIGFFLHIPFPPPDVLVAMPEYEWLINSMLEYDVLGFQTKTDHANFCRFVFGLLGGEMLSQDTLMVSGKRLTVSVFPVGIDVDHFVSMAQTPQAETQI